MYLFDDSLANQHLKSFHCKLCQLPLSQDDEIFVLEHAPISAQYLPSPSSFREGFTSSPLILYQCSGCGHIQLMCQPVPYWKEVISAAGLSSEMREFRLSQLSEWIQKYQLMDKNILDVGCGAGYMLELLSTLGVNAEGIEYNNDLVAKGIAKGLNLRRDYILDDHSLSNSYYDGFLCINFLEHSPNPLAFLRAVRSVCKPGALGIVEVPNFDLDILNSKSHNLIRDHLSYFTSTTINAICLLAGFEVLSVRECWYRNDLEVQLKVPYPSPLSDWKYGTPTTQSLSKTIESESGPIAIWGASHQTLTLLSMVDTTKIICIADSAPFKQGRVDPVCGIPIVSPEEMIVKKPALVIVIAAGFSNEVKNILLNTLNYNGRALTLDEIVN